MALLRLVTLALVAVAFFACAPTALAIDSHAPPGARASWLPNEDWVLNHWLPYDERALYKALRIRNRQGLGGRISDTRSLARFARSRGLKPKRLITKLMKPWRGHVSPEQYALLFRRAQDTFTQKHLAVHMFFHPFHTRMIDNAWLSIFNVSNPDAYGEAYDHGISLLSVARRHGRSPRVVRAQVRQVLARKASLGVQRLETTKAAARSMQKYELTQVDSWLRWRPRTKSAKTTLCHLGG